jgi:hypothetical protein
MGMRSTILMITKMENVPFRGHYEDWQQSRKAAIEKYLPDEFFVGKSSHEIGCGTDAFFSQLLRSKGCEVSASDGRTEYLNNLPFPTSVVDCDGELVIDRVDILVHFGVLYHLRNVETHLLSLGKVCDYILLESEVCDSTDDDIFYVEEEGYDQALHCCGSRPSSQYVENRLAKAGFSFKRFDDKILNSDFHVYDWETTNSKTFRNGQRRFWICWKDTVCSFFG